ncbi:MAG: HIT family protein [Saprospiraceae bacterium]
MASIFSRIIAGEIPCHKVAETEDYLAFLDISPRTEGHTLVIPKKEVDYIFDLDEATYAGLWAFAARVAAAVEKVVPCQRIGITVIGLEVPHTHIHLIPLNRIGDVNFERPGLRVDAANMSDLAARIAAAYQEL